MTLRGTKAFITFLGLQKNVYRHVRMPNSFFPKNEGAGATRYGGGAPLIFGGLFLTERIYNWKGFWGTKLLRFSVGRFGGSKGVRELYTSPTT